MHTRMASDTQSAPFVPQITRYQSWLAETVV